MPWGERARRRGSWLGSFVSEGKTRAFCVYQVPTLPAIHKTAARHELPVEQITQVRVGDPYFYS